MHVLNQDLDTCDYPSNELLWFYLTGLQATNQVIACPLICNMNLACRESTRLDCCDVIFAAGELGMTIISLGRLYFVLSCQLAPTDVVSMQHGSRVGSGGTCDLTGSHPS
jgi:hypothetical protein